MREPLFDRPMICRTILLFIGVGVIASVMPYRQFQPLFGRGLSLSRPPDVAASDRLP